MLGLGLRDPNIASTSWGRLRLEAAGRANVSGSLSVNGGLSIAKALSVGGVDTPGDGDGRSPETSAREGSRRRRANGRGGGIHTLDIEAEGSIWARNAILVDGTLSVGTERTTSAKLEVADPCWCPATRRLLCSDPYSGWNDGRDGRGGKRGRRRRRLPWQRRSPRAAGLPADARLRARRCERLVPGSTTPTTPVPTPRSRSELDDGAAGRALRPVCSTSTPRPCPAVRAEGSASPTGRLRDSRTLLRATAGSSTRIAVSRAGGRPRSATCSRSTRPETSASASAMRPHGFISAAADNTGGRKHGHPRHPVPAQPRRRRPGTRPGDPPLLRRDRRGSRSSSSGHQQRRRRPPRLLADGRRAS